MPPPLVYNAGAKACEAAAARSTVFLNIASRRSLSMPEAKRQPQQYEPRAQRYEDGRIGHDLKRGLQHHRPEIVLRVRLAEFQHTDALVLRRLARQPCKTDESVQHAIRIIGRHVFNGELVRLEIAVAEPSECVVLNISGGSALLFFQACSELQKGNDVCRRQPPRQLARDGSKAGFR